MKLSVKTRNIIIAVAMALTAIFVFGYISGKKRGDRASQAVISSLNNTLSTYSTTLNKTKVTVAQKEQVILTQREALKQDSLTREELRKLNIKQATEITRLKFRVDTLLEDVNNSGGVITIHDTITLKPTNYIKLPFVVTKNDKWLSLKDSTDTKGKTFISLGFQTSADLYVGIDKTTNKYTATVVTDDPYFSVVSINSVKMDTPKDKRYGIGLQGGYGVMFGSPLRSGFYLGAGFSYAIIRW